MSIFNKAKFLMKQKRGVIPRRIWNAFVEEMSTHIISHVEGGKLRKVHGVSTTLVIDRLSGGGPVEDSCPLGDYTVDPADDTKVIISPGWLHAPNKSVLLEPQSLTPTASTSVWVKCPWTATLNDDDVLEAGGELGTAVVETGASVPANVVPHVASLTGTYYVPLGAWDGDVVWVREGCGAITVSFCPRVFSFVRGE